MALLRRHPLPVPLLLAFLFAASRGDDDSYNPSMCLQPPQLCGNIGISYPFYLSNETGVLPGKDDGNNYCGYPGLGIQCTDGNKAVLQLGDGMFKVSDINYDDSTVSLVDQESFKDMGCPRIDHNVTRPQKSWLTYPSTTVDYLLFFLHCPPFLATQFNIRPISCGGSFFGQSSFVLRRNEVPSGELFWLCPTVIEVPVLQLQYQDARRNESRWINGGYGDALRSGFQFEWERTKPPACIQCEQSQGRCAYNQDGDFKGCLCSDGRVKAQSCSGHRRRTIIIYTVASASGLLLLCLAFYLSHKYGYSLQSETNKDTPRIESFLQKNGNIHPKRYTYAELKRMTKSFDVKLGQGGFGAVYRGKLPDGRKVAVKMLKDTMGDGEEFMNEVSSISRTSHVNVVTLLGFCLQGPKRALVYEYMPNGSLERYAFNNNNISSENTMAWEKLFEVAIGIARGLEYLHRGCNTRIVHFDIKPHNILLDKDFCPKISDFGLAKLCLNKDQSAISIAGARGTIGYIAPEVYSKLFGTVSSKSDVYSYGMMVLEMVGARDRSNNNASSESSSQYFPQWVYDHLDDYCISASEINGETTELVRKMIVVGLWCIQVTPTNRPTMTRVVEMLEGSTSTLELPPKMLLT